MAKLTVCGGGNAAHVLVALAASAGWEVDVFAPLADEAQRLQAGVAARGGIVARTRNSQVMGTPRRISAEPGDVIPGSQLILMALPAFAHGQTLAAIADHLDRSAAIGAMPARSGFDFQVHSLFKGSQSLTFFGMQTLPWACRIKHYGQEVDILGSKAAVDIASVPADQIETVIDQLAFIPDVEFTPTGSLLTMTLANTGQLIHPGIMYGLCQGRERDTFPSEQIPLFYQGVDDFTASVLQAMSDEVQSVADAVAASVPVVNRSEVPSLFEWLLRAYPLTISDSSTLGRAFVTNTSYAGLRVPTRLADGSAETFTVDFRARYLSEDVPFGLVVLRGIAELAGVITPMIDRVILWAQEQLGRSYLENGRLTGKDLAETRAPQAYGITRIEQLV